MFRLTAVIVSIQTCLLLAVVQGAAQEPTRPAAHWGTFIKKKHSLADCLVMAEDAMKREGYKLFEKGGHVRIGGNKAVIVQVTCVPTDKSTTSITVSAFSSDSKAAELARNKVREYIVKTVRID